MRKLWLLLLLTLPGCLASGQTRSASLGKPSTDLDTQESSPILPANAVGVSFAPTALDRTETGYLIVLDPTGGDASLRTTPYRPEAGDLLLYTQSKYEKLFQLVGTAAPTHSAIVFERPDGIPASLELTGPQVITAKVHHLDVGTRLHGYPGSIIVRRSRMPLTREQSAALTKFALAQEGKDFALGRLALQATPFHCHSGWRRTLFGHTYLDRSRWLCSEIAVAGATVAGLLDPQQCPANAMYPRDLAYDESYNLSATYQPPLQWVPHPNPVMHGDRVTYVRD